MNRFEIGLVLLLILYLLLASKNFYLLLCKPERLKIPYMNDFLMVLTVILIPLIRLNTEDFGIKFDIVIRMVVYILITLFDFIPMTSVFSNGSIVLYITCIFILFLNTVIRIKRYKINRTDKIDEILLMQRMFYIGLIFMLYYMFDVIEIWILQSYLLMYIVNSVIIWYYFHITIHGRGIKNETRYNRQNDEQINENSNKDAADCY